VFLYDDARASDAVGFFTDRVEALGLDPDDVAVLVRTISFAERVNGSVSANASRIVKAVGEAAEAFRAGRPLQRRAIQNLEEALAELAWGEASLRSRSLEERVALRAQALALLELLPQLTGPLRAWIAGARSAVASALAPLASAPAIQPGQRLRARPGDDTVDAGTAFSAGDDDPRRARTIHSAKGESHNAVLLLAQRPAGGRDFPREWVTHLLGGSRTEETRVAYVAMTRARRYVAVALPGATPNEVVGAYIGTGMVLIDRA
jgi:DNA helicase-2/ATP-dependent DNA helicase PcrA